MLLTHELTFDDVADLAPPRRSAAKDPLGLPHAALLPFPPAIVEAARDVFRSLPLDQDRGELVAHEEDVVRDLELSHDWIRGTFQLTGTRASNSCESHRENLMMYIFLDSIQLTVGHAANVQLIAHLVKTPGRKHN